MIRIANRSQIGGSTLNTTRTIIGLACVALAFLSTASCSRADVEGTEKPKVVVSILPQAYFVERISGGRVDALVIVGSGQSPHSYEPSPSQIADIGKAKAWFTIGVEFENALKPKIASLYPGLPIVPSNAGVAYRSLEAHSHEGEDGNESGGQAEDLDDDAEGGPDPHVWLGRQASKAIASCIAQGLTSIDPEGAQAYEKGYEDLIGEIDALFDSLVAELARFKGSPVLVFHPAFGYILDELGLRQIAVETGGKEPTQKALAALIDEARKDGARTVFVQAQYPTSAAETVARAIGGSVVPLDPLARDWLSNLRRIGAALRDGLGR